MMQLTITPTFCFFLYFTLYVYSHSACNHIVTVCNVSLVGKRDAKLIVLPNYMWFHLAVIPINFCLTLSLLKSNILSTWIHFDVNNSYTKYNAVPDTHQINESQVQWSYPILSRQKISLEESYEFVKQLPHAYYHKTPARQHYSSV